jgi:hypothetical protein
MVLRYRSPVKYLLRFGTISSRFLLFSHWLRYLAVLRFRIRSDPGLLSLPGFVIFSAGSGRLSQPLVLIPRSVNLLVIFTFWHLLKMTFVTKWCSKGTRMWLLKPTVAGLSKEIGSGSGPNTVLWNVQASAPLLTITPHNAEITFNKVSVCTVDWGNSESGG